MEQSINLCNAKSLTSMPLHLQGTQNSAVVFAFQFPRGPSCCLDLLCMLLNHYLPILQLRRRGNMDTRRFTIFLEILVVHVVEKTVFHGKKSDQLGQQCLQI